jgi:hypothetical protein
MSYYPDFLTDAEIAEFERDMREIEQEERDAAEFDAWCVKMGEMLEDGNA